MVVEVTADRVVLAADFPIGVAGGWHLEIESANDRRFGGHEDLRRRHGEHVVGVKRARLGADRQGHAVEAALAAPLGVGGTDAEELRGSAVVATANGGMHGLELITQVGSTRAHTVIDIRPGPDGAEPQQLTRIGDEIWSRADDGTHGREAWALPLTALGAPNLPIFGKACSNLSGALLSTFGQPRLGASDFGAVVGRFQANTSTVLRFGNAASRTALPGGCTMRTPEIVSIGR